MSEKNPGADIEPQADDGANAQQSIAGNNIRNDKGKVTSSTTSKATQQPNESNDASNHEDQTSSTTAGKTLWKRFYDTVFFVPRNCRWDPNEPPKFSMPLNVLFAFAGAFTVANLYYNHPILNILAHDFQVPYEKVAQIPTVAQAGYAGGLFFLCPLGDLLPRRPFVLSLVLFTATVSIGLCLAQTISTFSAIQAIVGFTTVTPQLMLPLVGDLAPPKRRGAALSIVVSGFILGILIARLLSGVITNFISWRYVYWMSVGLQYLIFISLWAFMPDYPATNKKLNYFKMLWSMFGIFIRNPVLVQASLISLFTSSTFTCFWTVLTFLLSGPPYNYSPVVIGLFALVGIATMFCTPLYGRYVVDRFVPWFSVILGMGWCMLGICLGAYTGTFTVAGPILQAWFLDLGVQTSQVANRSSIYSIEPLARNRVNTVFMIFVFFGQLLGTSVGAHIYSLAGWPGSQSWSVAAIGTALIITLLRGPYQTGWFGYSEGLSIFKKVQGSADGKAEEQRNPLRRLNTNERASIAADVEKGRIDASEEQVQTDGKSAAVESAEIRDDGSDEKASSKSEDADVIDFSREQGQS